MREKYCTEQCEILQGCCSPALKGFILVRIHILIFTTCDPNSKKGKAVRKYVIVKLKFADKKSKIFVRVLCGGFSPVRAHLTTTRMGKNYAVAAIFRYTTSTV